MVKTKENINTQTAYKYSYTASQHLTFPCEKKMSTNFRVPDEMLVLQSGETLFEVKSFLQKVISQL